MGKEKVLRIALSIVLVALIIGSICLYLYGIIYAGKPFYEDLIKFLCILVPSLLMLIRLNVNGVGGKRGSVSDYERAYAEELGNAFRDKPMLRTKLICACRLYNESNYRKALKYLFQLLPAARNEGDRVPVLTFIALCYTDGGAPLEAVRVYEELLKNDPYNSQAHSNVGLLYVKMGNHEKGVFHYEKALEYNPVNYYAAVNYANYYFRIHEYERAAVIAKKALEMKNDGVEAASLLALLYALMGKKEEKEKYFHIAVVLGKNPKDINESIAYFKQQD